jgi:hypothetical protein
VKALDQATCRALRARLQYALDRRPGDDHAGSLLLYALGACWLAMPDEPDPDAVLVSREAELELAFYAQAAAEGLDGDETITWIILVGEGGVPS